MRFSRNIIRGVIVLLSSIFYLLSSAPTQAVCPVCTLAVGGGVMLSRYLGVDDLIIGVWIGGLIISLGLWWSEYLKKHYFKGQEWVVVLLTWLMTVWGLKQGKFIGHPYCKIFGQDKLLVGIVFGNLMFLVGFLVDLFLRRYNKKKPGKALFPYQKVVLPVGSLVIATLIALQICRLGIK